MDQRFLIPQKISPTDALKTALERAIQKTAEEMGDLVGNKIAVKITKAVSKNTHEDRNKSTMPVKIDKTSTPSIGIPKER